MSVSCAIILGLVVVGVGDRVNEDDLYSVTENTDNIFMVEDYEALESSDLILQVLARIKFFGELKKKAFDSLEIN